MHHTFYDALITAQIYKAKNEIYHNTHLSGLIGIFN